MLKPAFLVGVLLGLFTSLAVSGLAFMGPLNGWIDLLWLIPVLSGSVLGLYVSLGRARARPGFLAGFVAGAFSGPLVAAACELVVWLIVGLRR